MSILNLPMKQPNVRIKELENGNNIQGNLEKWFSRYKPYIEYEFNLEPEKTLQVINMVVAGVPFSVKIDLERNGIEFSDNYYEDFNETNMWKVLFFDSLIT